MSIAKQDGTKTILPRTGPDHFWKTIHNEYAGEDQRKWKYLAMLALRENAGWPLDYIGNVFGHPKGHVTRCLQKIKAELHSRFRMSPDLLELEDERDHETELPNWPHEATHDSPNHPNQKTQTSPLQPPPPPQTGNPRLPTSRTIPQRVPTRPTDRLEPTNRPHSRRPPAPRSAEKPGPHRSRSLRRFPLPRKRKSTQRHPQRADSESAFDRDVVLRVKVRYYGGISAVDTVYVTKVDGA